MPEDATTPRQDVNSDIPLGLDRAERVGAAERGVQNTGGTCGRLPGNSLDTLSAHLWDLVSELRRFAASEEAIALRMKESSQKRANIWGRAASYQDAANRLEKVLRGSDG